MDGIAYKRTYHKPFTHGETSSSADLGYSQCDNDATWMGAFTGICTSPLLWENQHRQDLWVHFGRLRSFISGYDFNEDGGWVADHDQYIQDKLYWVGLSNGFYESHPEYIGVVETFYLRSPDEEHAIGIVANNTYNFYTEWECTTPPFVTGSDDEKAFRQLDDNEEGGVSVEDDKPWVLVNDDMYSNKRTISYDDEKIYIKGLSGYAGPMGKRYNIDFISPYTLNVISTVTDRKGPNGVQIKYPDIRGLQETSMYLIRVYPFKDRSTEQNPYDSVQYQYAGFEQFNYSVDISQTDNFEIKIYPNPANDELNIEIPCISGLAYAFIYDLTGRTVLSKETYDAKTEMNISDINPGTYVLKVLAPNCTKTFKFVKQ